MPSVEDRKRSKFKLTSTFLLSISQVLIYWKEFFEANSLDSSSSGIKTFNNF